MCLGVLLACETGVRRPLDDAGPPTDGAMDGAPGDMDMPDAGPPPDLPPPDLAPPPCNDLFNACPEGEACIDGECVAGEGPCTGDDECANDTYCEDGICLPWETRPGGDSDATCVRLLPPASGVLEPEIQCAWREGAVIMTPLVIDLDGLELDGRLIPEIVFVTYETLGATRGELVAITGDTCTEIWREPIDDYRLCGELAAGDLDGDGLPDIVVVGNSSVQAFAGRLGIPMWRSRAIAVPNAPALADVDLDGDPDVVFANGVLDGATGRTLWARASAPNDWPVPAVADVDLDGRPEIVRGSSIVDAATGVDETPAPMAAGGQGVVAIGELDDDTPEPEIVVASSAGYLGTPVSTIRVHRASDGEVIFGPFDMPQGSRFAGVPTIADLDGDGRREFAAAAGRQLNAYDFDCLGDGRPAECESEGVLWTREVQDDSGAAGVSVFDFQDDGQPEVVYADECFLRAYDGVTGRATLAATHTSGTCFEVPVIADADGDGQSEIVQSENTTAVVCPPVDPETGTPYRGGVDGVTVYEDPDGRWVPSRPVWNQNSYHITNVNADGTIPSPEPNSWDTFNNYRQNEPGVGEPQELRSPDATVGRTRVLRERCPEEITVRATVANRGAGRLESGMTVAFYDRRPEDPSATQLCAVATRTSLAPGAQLDVECAFEPPPAGESIDVHVRVDDGDAVGECLEGNNTTVFPEVGCFLIE